MVVGKYGVWGGRCCGVWGEIQIGWGRWGVGEKALDFNLKIDYNCDYRFTIPM
jgi:hypothetical protein